MSKDDSKGSDGAGIAGISRNDIFVEANASNIEGNSDLLRSPTFSFIYFIYLFICFYHNAQESTGRKQRKDHHSVI